MKKPARPTNDHFHSFDDLSKIRKEADKERRSAERKGNIVLAISILAFALSLLGALPRIIDMLSLPR